MGVEKGLLGALNNLGSAFEFVMEDRNILRSAIEAYLKSNAEMSKYNAGQAEEGISHEALIDDMTDSFKGLKKAAYYSRKKERAA